MHYNVSKNFLHLVREGERFMWLNENAGVMILIIGIAVITMMGIALWILFGLRSQFQIYGALCGGPRHSCTICLAYDRQPFGAGDRFERAGRQKRQSLI